MSYCVRGAKRRVDDTVVPLSSCNVGTAWRWVYITWSAQCELTSGRQTGEETYSRAEVPGRGPPEGSGPPCIGWKRATLEDAGFRKETTTLHNLVIMFPV